MVKLETFPFSFRFLSDCVKKKLKTAFKQESEVAYLLEVSVTNEESSGTTMVGDERQSNSRPDQTRPLMVIICLVPFSTHLTKIHH